MACACSCSDDVVVVYGQEDADPVCNQGSKQLVPDSDTSLRCLSALMTAAIAMGGGGMDAVSGPIQEVCDVSGISLAPLAVSFGELWVVMVAFRLLF